MQRSKKGTTGEQKMVRTKEDVIMIKDKLMSSFILANPSVSLEEASAAADEMLEKMDKHSHFRWVLK